MNAIGYAIRRVARSIGIKSEMNRRRAITREMQLLAEAESILGRAAWSDSENIAEIAEEFYQIRHLKAEAMKVKNEIRALKKENNRLLSEQEKLEAVLEGKIATLSAAKSKEMQRTVALMREVENLRIDAEITHKKYSGARLRLKSLLDAQAPADALEPVRGNLAQLKQEYAHETKQIVDRQEDLKVSDAEIFRLENLIADTREGARSKLSALMGEVGRSSNLLARHSAKLGSIEKAIGDLCFTVGSYLSSHSDHPTPEIKQVISKHRDLVSKLTSLKSSIRFNRILSGQRR